MREIGREYRTRVLLCFVDVEDSISAIQAINLVAIKFEFILILTWSYMEGARYLETLKSYENKSATIIRERVDAEYLPMLNDVLTTVRAVNKTDALTLISTFGTFGNVATAPLEVVALCPGLGEVKVRTLREAFTEPFI